MIKYDLESAMSAAFDKAMVEQYRRAVRGIADSIMDMRDMPFLYDEADIETYKTGAVMGLMWMVDGKAPSSIEQDITLAVANLAARIID